MNKEVNVQEDDGIGCMNGNAPVTVIAKWIFKNMLHSHYEISSGTN
jgi:hypothetical protein